MENHSLLPQLWPEKKQELKFQTGVVFVSLPFVEANVGLLIDQEEEGYISEFTTWTVVLYLSWV